MRWLMNGMTDSGRPLTDYVSEEDLLEMSVMAIQEAGQDKIRESPPGNEPLSFVGGSDKNRPDEHGWLLVVPDDDEGRAIVERLAPLIEHRIRARETSSEALKRRPEEVIRYFPLTAAQQPALGEWDEKNIMFTGEEGESPPFYILVAGPPSKIPFELEYLISRREQCAGRLAFSKLEDYQAYAHKVIAWEPDDDYETTVRKGFPVGVFATDHGENDPTRYSRLHLVQPVVEQLRRDPSRVVTTCMGQSATCRALLELLRGDGVRPGGQQLLLSASHGLAVPGRDRHAQAERLQKQGSIWCQGASSIVDEDDILSTSSLGEAPILAGGVWMMFACFGAGTPAGSTFFRTSGARSLLGVHDGGPFVAALPTRMLSDPDGPLAVVGHVDPSFVNAFWDSSQSSRRYKAIYSVLAMLLRGNRLGVATSSLGSAANSFGESFRQLEDQLARALKKTLGGASTQELVSALAQAEAGSVVYELRDILVETTVSYYDFRNFVILGDPAVKLPRAGAERVDVARRKSR